MKAINAFVRTHPEIRVEIEVEKEDIYKCSGTQIRMFSEPIDLYDGYNYRSSAVVTRQFSMDATENPETINRILFEMYDAVQKEKQELIKAQMEVAKKE